MFSLLITYYRGTNNIKQSEIYNVTAALQQYAEVTLAVSKVMQLMKIIDSSFQSGIQKCYTSFCAINEPIVAWDVINKMVVSYRTLMPHHYNLLKIMMGYVV